MILRGARPNARIGVLSSGSPVIVDARIKPYLDLYPLPNGPISGDTAKYIFGGTIDSSGAGRFAAASGTNGGTMAFGYVLDGVYSGLNAATGSSINLSNAWEVTGFYEHYWNPAWRTSVFGNYSSIS